MDRRRLLLFSGNASRELAEDIAICLRSQLGKRVLDKYPDTETRVEVHENVRGADTFIIQSIARPVNDSIMEVILMADALKRASAYRITAVIPYFAYARQDRKVKPRVPISAKLMADLLCASGIDRVLTMDLHAAQIQGFFDLPVDNLYASPVFLPYIREHFSDNLVVVAPDAGGVPRARAYVDHLHAELALIDKRRDEPGKARAISIVGEVSGKRAVILDDMVDTGGTLVEAAKALEKNGASEVHAICTHPVLSGPAVQRLKDAPIESLVFTDTLPLPTEAEGVAKIKVLSTATLFCKAIHSIHFEESISSLFELRH